MAKEQTMASTDSLHRLQGLFRELFQLDSADLDFGIYRLFHLKRAEVEAFLTKQLPEEVARAFEASAGAERETGSVSSREEGRNMFYPVFVKKGSVTRLGEVPADEFHPGVKQRVSREGEVEVWPIDSEGNERKWRYKAASLKPLLKNLTVRQGRDGRQTIYLKKDEEAYRTVWSDPKYNAAEHGSTLLKRMGLGDFSFPKSIHTTSDCLRVGFGGEDGIVLDYFGGSGTTAHSVIAMNRGDGLSRRFIVVECADYFKDVLLPRVQKIMFAPEWKDGKPVRLPTKDEVERTPQLVKVLRLESYEDALHNTFSERAVTGAAEREKAHREALGDDMYRVRYLAKLPVEASDSMLSLAKLEHPFDYTLEVLADNGPKVETVDVVETFNWLYGLRVHRLLTWANEKDKGGKDKDGRRYSAVVASDREGKKRVLVVWRDMTGLDPKVERAFLEAKAGEAGTFEEMLINGDTVAKGFSSLDGLFKRLMEEGER